MEKWEHVFVFVIYSFHHFRLFSLFVFFSLFRFWRINEKMMERSENKKMGFCIKKKNGGMCFLFSHCFACSLFRLFACGLNKKYTDAISLYHVSYCFRFFMISLLLNNKMKTNLCVKKQ